MQNKGFVIVLSTLLGIACLWCLSFTFVDRYYGAKADKYAHGNLALKNHYLDSISTEKVYFGMTLKKVREKSLGLGLDLKGGMNVVLEVDVPTVIKSLARTDDPKFNQAFNEALKQNTKGSNDDFLTLFEKKYKEIAPDGKLANIFSITMKDKISPSDSNDKVFSELRKEVESISDNSFEVLRNRIDRFGVVAPNFQKLQRKDRILIELPGIKKPERVRKLLQGGSNLEFWKTYNVSQIASYIDQVNMRSAEYLAANKENVTDSAASEESNGSKTAFKTPLNGCFKSAYYLAHDVHGPIIGIASVKDTAEINTIFRKYRDLLPADLNLKWSFKSMDERGDFYQLYALKGDGSKRGPALTGDVVRSAKADQNPQNGQWGVSMSMNSRGTSRWASITGAEKGKCIAIVIDNLVYSAPVVNSAIENGSSEISGNFSPEESKDLANVLNSGKMKAGVKIVQEDVIGPSLGKEAIQKGMLSFVIALIVVMAFMCIMYGFIPGMVVDFALIINLFFTIGALASFHAVLSLPGIAGLVLAMGMAVDANVLIYERTKEELAKGKGIRLSIEEGYKHAFSAIFDSNLTTIITAGVLAYFGSGAIRGFAITLIIGIISSFLTAVYITRVIYEKKMAKGKWQHLKFTTSLSKNILKNPSYKFLENSKKWIIGSAVLIVAGIISLFTLGLNEGIDFTGGRNYVLRFDKPVKTAAIYKALEKDLGESVKVITIGSSNQVRISTNYKIKDSAESVDSEIRSFFAKDLKPFMGDKTIDQVIQSSQTVGPSIAKDMFRSAAKALLIAIIFMGIYIFIRFRDLAFSWASIIAVAHDSFIVIALYSLLYKILPISLEIDQSFIAAILTVVGYSLNDKVVIFDRIREFQKLYPSISTKKLIDDSLNTTLERTIATSLSTLIVVICIFIFGGDAIRSFIFALMIGIIVGTYSSWFIATPVAYYFWDKKKIKE